MKDISLFNEKDGTNLIIKTAGNACNLNCRYCFEKVKHVDHSRIDIKTFKNILDAAQPPCSVVMHGGEPLVIGLEYFDQLLALLRTYYPKKINIVRVQTNGTLLTQQWIDLFFEKYRDLNIEIAISLDGPPEMNALRVDEYDHPTYDQVRHAFRLLEQNNKKVGLLSVISKGALKYAKEYIDMLETIPNLSFVKINALFNVEADKLTSDSITPTQYSQFIIETSKYYINKGLYKQFAMEPLLSILQQLNGKLSRYCNYSGRKCYNYISVYPDGSLGPCDCFSVNRFQIPHQAENKLVDSVKASQESSGVKYLCELIQKCRSCDIHDFCMGGCLSQRYYFSGNDVLTEDFCASKHLLFDAFQSLSFLKGHQQNAISNQ